MRIFFAVLALVLWNCGANAQQAGGIACNSSVVYDNNTNGSTKLITGTSSKSIYICGYGFMAGGTVNVKLIYGTGTACATGATALTPAYQFTAQTGFVDPSPYFRGMYAPTGKDVCINASAGKAVQAVVYYVAR